MWIVSTACLLMAVVCFLLKAVIGTHLRSDFLAWGLAFLAAGLALR